MGIIGYPLWALYPSPFATILIIQYITKINWRNILAELWVYLTLRDNI